MTATQSYTMSVGPEGLSGVLECFTFTTILKSKLYAFENDFAAVEKFRENLSKVTKNVEVVKVMCDRICTAREIGPNNRVNVVCEDYRGTAVIFGSKLSDCCPFTSPSTKRKTCSPSNIILAHSVEEEQFYYNRKFSLLNGIHYTMAVFAYNAMLRDGVPRTKWSEQQLTMWKQDPSNIKDLQLMIQARILKLLSQTDRKTLYKIYNTYDLQKIYNELKGYSSEVLVRIEKSKDTAGRILNLNDKNRFAVKYQQHYLALKEFFNSNSLKMPAFVVKHPVQLYKTLLLNMQQKIEYISPVNTI